MNYHHHDFGFDYEAFLRGETEVKLSTKPEIYQSDSWQWNPPAKLLFRAEPHEDRRDIEHRRRRRLFKEKLKEQALTQELQYLDDWENIERFQKATSQEVKTYWANKLGISFPRKGSYWAWNSFKNQYWNPKAVHDRPWSKYPRRKDFARID